ncbi:uncharacterized protein [Gossypium hirsutum]|uniref:Retrovirus-related Pol polyprotein from transposon TNT 1-94 n=1 Tax=Gossypium hirsutum TaxID=3635 RepID=A0A1U8NMJ8_GOSHI|nr:uncharacterized protein LOC107949990 [Gossypium hirsutum]
MAPPVFDGDNYQMWAMRMETYLEALDLWEAVEEDYDILSLPANPTMAQIKTQKEKKTRKSKLKAEYARDERIRGMQVLNLIRDLELQKMKESESVKEYSDRFLSIANKVRLLGSELSDSRIVEKLLVTVPEKFEATITTLENTKDLSEISLAELLNALQAQEQRRSMRQKRVVEGALPAKHQDNNRYKKKKNLKNHPANGENSFSNYQKGKGRDSKKTYPPYQHCGKKEAQVADQEEEDRLFVVTCFSSRESSESWLIDSGCTNHMTYDKELFEELRTTEVKRVKIGNGEHLTVKGKGTIAIISYEGTKTITDVLFVPEIDQNLLSVGKLLEKGYKVLFENKRCLIRDADGKDLFKVEMKGKSFALNPIEEEQKTFKSKFCEEARIEHQLTSLYTPQQNGVNERRNRFIMEVTRCMLREKNLPKIKRDKLDKKAAAGIFIGYSTVSNAYRVFQLQTDRIIVSRDVHFVEDEQWSWKDSKKANQTSSVPKHFTTVSVLEELEDENGRIR